MTAASPEKGPDPRLVALRAAVTRLHQELAAYRVELPDRAIAEEELAWLGARLTASPPPEPAELRRSLLVVAAALGSVSALREAFGEVRWAVERL